MGKKIVCRRLSNNNDYYQIYKVVDNLEKLESIPNYIENINAKEFYIELPNIDGYSDEDLLYGILKRKNNVFEFIDNGLLNLLYRNKFYSEYKDFKLVPNMNINVNELTNKLKEEVFYQDESIDKLVSVLNSNFDILNSGIDEKMKEELKENIILCGIKGHGKTTILNTLLENIDIPSVKLKITGNLSEDFNNIVSSLIEKSGNNPNKISNGIIILEDNFEELEGTDKILSDNEDCNSNIYSYIKKLINEKEISLLYGGERLVIDLSHLTYIIEINTPSDNYESIFDTNIGFSEDIFNDFTHIIKVSKMTKEEAKDIILNNPKSYLNLYKKVLSSVNKELVVEEKFINFLVDNLYKTSGLDIINECIATFIKKKWNQQKIVLGDEFKYMKFNLNNDNQDELVEENFAESSKNAIVDKKMTNNDKRNELLRKYEYLKQYVKGQDKPLLLILYQIFINDLEQNSHLSVLEKNERIKHLLIRGEPGSGKTYISTLVANTFKDKPHIIADCKQYTEAGYVGKSVDDLLLQLYNVSGGNLDKAQKGLLILDEFDKLAINSRDSSDVNRGGVQESLLKLFEGSVFEINIGSSMQPQKVMFDTSNLIIVCLGAFEGLNRIRDERIKKEKGGKTIGFASNNQTEKYIDYSYTLDDMKNFGMLPQLLRRVTFREDLNKLNRNNFKEIMLESKSSRFLIKINQLKELGIEIIYDDDFIEAFLDKVVSMGYGVSSIDILINDIFQSFEAKAFIEKCKRVVLNKECVDDPSKVSFVFEKSQVKEKKKVKKY